jgi:hypothetical protein
MNSTKIEKSKEKPNWNSGNNKLNITYKISNENLSNRMDQVENRVLGTE